MKRRLDILRGKPVEPVENNLERITEHYQAMDEEELYQHLDRLIDSGPEQDLQVVCTLLSSREEEKITHDESYMDVPDPREGPIRDLLASEEGLRVLSEALAAPLLGLPPHEALRNAVQSTPIDGLGGDDEG